MWEKLLEFFRSEGEFHLPISFSLLAFFTFGITGALAAMRRGYDIVGVLFLATITSGGGGLIRDGVLISKGPALMLTDARYILVVVAATPVAYVFHRHVQRLQRTIAVIEALGLGAFAVQGVSRSLEAGLSTPAAVLGGTITTVGGGLLRDILVREEPLLFKPGQFYALAAMGGCCLFVLLLRSNWISPHDAAVTTIVAVFVFRMLTIRFNWRTTALYREPASPS